MKVRRGIPADAAALTRVAAELFEQTYGGSVPSEELERHLATDFSRSKQLGELQDPEIATLLVEGSPDLIGFAQLRCAPIPLSSDEPADVELWRIYVDARHHGSGVGKRLLAAAGQAARAFHASGVWLGVWEANPRAIAFYHKHGFQVVGQHNFQVGSETQIDLIMRASADAF